MTVPRSQLAVLQIIMLVLLMSGCDPAETEKAADSTRIRTVAVKRIEEQALPVVVSAVGRLAPNRSVWVAAEVSGTVTHRHVDLGHAVSHREELVRLDATDYQLALSEARANLSAAEARYAVARKSYDRAGQLASEDVVTQEAYDRFEGEYRIGRATVNQLKAIVEIAERRYGKTRITAPFEGHILSQNVEAGQLVNVGEPLLHVGDLDPMRVVVYLNETDHVGLDRADPVTVVVDAFGDRSFEGRIDRIGIDADPRTNTFAAEILVDNSELTLKSGLTARVDVITDTIPKALMIPQSCLLFRGDRTEVFVVTDTNHAAVRTVTVGQVDGGDVNILEGLSAGERLVTSGGQYLKDGDPVRVEGGSGERVE